MITEQKILDEVRHIASRRAVGDLSARLDTLRHAAYQYQISHCVHSKKLPICDCFGNQRVIDVPCGKCYHCRETMQNEWVTRMYYETKAHRFCYFVTLDYKSYPRLEHVPADLMNAYYVRDAANSRRSDGYHPCLLRIEHLQLFIKHLRDDARSAKKAFQSLTYYAAGEYGKRFGRPHFHVIIWSDFELTKADIIKAWSIRSGRKFMKYTPIGNHIDFNDLNRNGTLSGDAMLDGKQRSARFCFKYVCKYVNKAESVNLSRVKMAYDSMQSLRGFYREYWKLHHAELSAMTDRRFAMNNLLAFCSGKRMSQRLTDLRYPAFHRDVTLEYDNHQHIMDDCMCYENYINYEKYPNLPAPEKVFDLNFEEFLQLVRPFTTCSRAKGIGSNWLRLDNITRVVNGNTKFESSPLGELVMPRYYLRKISEIVQPYRFATPSGQTTRPHIAFNKGIYEVQMQAHAGTLYDGTLQIDVPCISLDDVRSISLCRKDFGCGVIKRLDCGRVLVPYFVHEYDRVDFVQLRYNKSTRTYLFDAYVPAPDLITCLDSHLRAEYARYVQFKRVSDERQNTLKAISTYFDLLSHGGSLWYLDCEGITFESILQDAAAVADAERVARQAEHDKEYAQRRYKPNF